MSAPRFPVSTSVPDDASSLAVQMFSVAQGSVVRELLASWALAASDALLGVGMADVRTSDDPTVLFTDEFSKAHRWVNCTDPQSGLTLHLQAGVLVANEARRFGCVRVYHELTCEDAPGSPLRRALHHRELLQSPLLSQALLQVGHGHTQRIERHLSAWLGQEFTQGVRAALRQHLDEAVQAMEP